MSYCTKTDQSVFSPWYFLKKKLWRRQHGRSRFEKIALLSCSYVSDDFSMHGLVFESLSSFKLSVKLLEHMAELTNLCLNTSL